MTYDLIAFDMDGTLLDSRKRVLSSSIEAIGQAAHAGKDIALCSGRCPVMVALYADELPHVRYAICDSGAVLFDLSANRVLSETNIEHELIGRVVEACAGEDAMPEAFSGRDFFCQSSQLGSMGHYQMGPYEGMYAATCTPVDSIRAVVLDPDTPFQKLGLHFTTTEARRRVRARLADLPLEVIDSETTSIELQAAGVDKAAGLLALAELLGIAPEATIAVGDADNDLAMVRSAGIGVAMGNANERVRAAANASVADNDHGGCAEAIHTYLL